MSEDDRTKAAGFDEFWNLYPRKVGKTKARSAWSAATKDAHVSDIIEAVQAYAAAVSQWPTDQQQFIPHPTTWLNRGQWEDDRETWKKATQSKNPMAYTQSRAGGGESGILTKSTDEEINRILDRS